MDIFLFLKMEEALNKAQQAIGQMIAELPPLATFSVKRDVRFWNITIVVKPEAESTPDVKKKKPSPSRLRRNQRRLRMFLERNKSAGTGEPDISGIKVTSAGELPASKGADSTPVTKPDGPALSTLETREDVSKQISSPANMEEEGTDDDIYSIHNDTSSSEQDSSGEGEDYSSEEESKDDIVPGVDQEKKKITMTLKEKKELARTLKECLADMEFRKKATDNLSTTRDSTIYSKDQAHMIKKSSEVPHEGEKPSTRSPSVTSRSLTSLDVDTMDLTPEDSVLPIQAKKAVKVPANIIENTAVTRQYVTVKRKSRKDLNDPNSCKTT